MLKSMFGNTTRRTGVQAVGESLAVCKLFSDSESSEGLGHSNRQYPWTKNIFPS